MPGRSLAAPAAVLAQLEQTPRALAAATEGVPDERLARRPALEEWSANEVLAHLRACADVWGQCVETILREDAPTIRAVNPTTWVEQTDYRALAFGASLRSFCAQRESLTRVLGSLSDDAWGRTATVTGAGRPLTRTVLDYASRLARHERSHLAQVADAVRGIASTDIR